MKEAAQLGPTSTYLLQLQNLEKYMASKRNEKKDRKARSRSRSVEKYPCPPSNPKELRAVLL